MCSLGLFVIYIFKHINKFEAFTIHTLSFVKLSITCREVYFSVGATEKCV